MTSADVPTTLPGLLTRSAEQWGERTALITEQERLTYSELTGLVDRYARALVSAGVGKGVRVGVLMENSPEWIALLFAVTGLGAVLVPVSTFSKPGDLAYQLRHADIALLIMSESFLGNDYLVGLETTLPELHSGESGALCTRGAPALRRVVVRGAEGLPDGCDDWEAFLAAGDRVPADLVTDLCTEVDPEDECLILYTSGTTARPKGVLHRHLSVAGNGYRIGERERLVPDDVVWFYFPLFFSAGCINVTLGTLSHGAAMIVEPAFDAGRALALIERERATTWHLWPHMLKRLTEHPDWEKRDHSTLHKGTGPYDLVMGFETNGSGGVNMYGMTETCTAFTCTFADDPGWVRARTQGTLLSGNEVKIIDRVTGEPKPTGESGEICVRGPAVMRRYYKVDPATTFDGDGFFRTGDQGSVDEEGRLHFEHRVTEMIKTGGINVSPAEVEAALYGIDGVEAAYAFAVPSADKGEEVGAAVVPAEGQTIDEAAVHTYCRDALPGYKRPRAVLVLPASDVPMTGTGKVQTFALRARLLAQEQADS